MTILQGLLMFIGFIIVLIIIAIIYTLYFNVKTLKSDHAQLLEDHKELLENNVVIPINKDQVFEFGSAMELVGLPVIVFTQNNKKFKFLIDTGSNVSYVNIKSKLKTTPLEQSESFMGAEGTYIDCTLGNIKLQYKDKEYEHTVRLADLSAAFDNVKKESNIELSGIIGNDFMEKYKYCIDFKEFVVYSRK